MEELDPEDEYVIRKITAMIDEWQELEYLNNKKEKDE